MSLSGIVSNGNSGGTSSSSYNSEKDKIWYFSAEQLTNSPSRRCGIKPDQELSYRQLTAYLIQEMGQRLQVSQLCINTAIVYMHRFYAFHSFTHFHRNSIAAASLFLAAKVEEQPRKLEHVIKAANKCLPSADVNYAEQAQDLVFNENVLLQTLGFDVAIDHPHTHVVKTCQLVKACKDLAQTSYFLASNSLHLTSMCLQYRPTVVACFCIYLACKWSRWEIPQSTEGKHWFYYVDKSVTLDLLKKLTDEFIAIYEKSPTRLQSKLNSIKAIAQGASNRGSKDKAKEDFKMGDIMKGYHSSINTDSNSNGAFSSCSDNSQSQTSSSALLPPPSQPLIQQPIRKPEIHSSQHRLPHGSSSVSGSHHHNKPAYTSDALADHKSKQSSSYGSTIVNRSTSNHQSSSTSSIAQRPNPPSSSSRPSSSSSLSSQRPSQTHPMDYHKSSSSRDRNGMNVITAASHGIAPLHTGHKMSHKQQDSSNNVRNSSSKDTSSRMPESTSKQPSNKIYPSGAPPFGNNQLPPPQPGKMDDSSRNLIHNQRSYVPTSVGNVGQPPNNYHHHRSGNLAGGNSLSNSSSSNNNSSKSSVHSMPHAPYDQLPPPYVNPSHQQSVNSGYGNIRGGAPDLQTQVDDNSLTHSSLHQLMTQQPPSQSKTSSASTSLFSPDWKDKQQSQQLLNGLSSHVQNDPLLYKLTGNNRDKNSPKKERSSSSSSGTPTKRDKSRLLTPSSSISGTSMPIPMSLIGTRNDQIQDQQAHLLKSGLPPPRKQEHAPGASTSLNELTGSNQIAAGGMKRSIDNTGYLKHDDDTLQRDNKIRKVDSLSSSQNPLSLSTFAFPGSVETSTDKHPISMANGMETTPDLVRSLLKESLCTSNALLKPEPLTMPGLKPPAELLDPSAGQSTGLFISSNIATEADVPGADQSSNADDKLDGSKNEKKKKKDKHKHKEKDKSKDREDRKKHKKDKDKHKDRDRDSENVEHVKLIIPKEKLDSTGGDLKIKIGKERFKSDVSNAGTTNTAPPNLGTAGLKIKISKEKLEIYNSGNVNAFSTNDQSQKNLSQLQQQSAHMQLGSSHGSGVSNLNPAMSGYGMAMVSNSAGGASGGNTSSKKKDRDRDKEKKRSSHEFLKYNGSANLMSGVLAATTSAPMMPMPPISLMTTANTSTTSLSSASSSYAKK